MSKAVRKNGSTSNLIRIKIRDSASGTDKGKTGLRYNSVGLVIDVTADVEDPVTVSATDRIYTQAAGTIESCSQIGNWLQPTANKIRFDEVDAVNKPGVYEIQFPNSRFNRTGPGGQLAKALHGTITGPDALGMCQCDFEIQLTATDVDNATTGGLANLDAAISSLPTAAAIATAVWSVATSALTGIGSIGKWVVDKVDVVLSTRFAASSYTAPDNASAAAAASSAATAATQATAAANSAATAATDTANIKTRLPAALSGGKMDSTAVVSDKIGFKLAEDGLDAISTAGPNGVASNFRERVNQLWRRFFGKTVRTATQINTYRDDNATAATTQDWSSAGGTQSVDEAVNA